jgi:hypothetical protein
MNEKFEISSGFAGKVAITREVVSVVFVEHIIHHQADFPVSLMDLKRTIKQA